MKYKTLIMYTILFLFFIGAVKAQKSVTTTSDNASGTGGTINYSIGQLVYTTGTGADGSSVQGIQQPYEFFVVAGIENKDINLRLTVHPNPTTDHLILTVDGDKLPDLNFQLYDLQGEWIESNKLSGTTVIPMTDLPSSTYFLKIMDRHSLVKTFKVIKN